MAKMKTNKSKANGKTAVKSPKVNEKEQWVLVAGGGGFIGGHLVGDLRRQGYKHIRCVDVKPMHEWYQKFDDVDNRVLDLNLRENCDEAAQGVYQIFNLAANMGGMGFIENNKALCMLSVLINTHLLQSSVKYGVKKFFYASSACVYNGEKQTNPDCPALKEADAYPALAEDGYGWEKLFSERMCRHFREDFGLYTRVARFHNVYGPNGTWDGGREKAPAAICRKVIHAKETGRHEIDIWGTGEQTRSFMYIDDCIKGIQKIMESDILDPINLGSSELVSINQLVDLVESIGNIKLKRTYDLSAPKGVNGRNSDNTLIQEYLGWEPGTRLRAGLAKTYAWIYEEYKNRAKGHKHTH
jgi:nucleoside-diphosphate-sugar epimerase